jgi:CelD/BcsL family acetyltransferase involved in cellulose biosynthesis
MIVSIGAPTRAMTGPFEALTRRAAGNVFMHPAALAAAAATSFAQVHALSAWHDGALVGFWALRERRIAPFWHFLAGPPYPYAFVANPVVDPAHVDTVMPAFLAAIADDENLPNVIQLKLLDGDAPTFRPLLAALAARGGAVLKLSERARPYLAAPSERKRSGSTAKKLRQDWNRLGAMGPVEIANDRDADGTRAAFEIFLELERRSWKGRNGTALLCREADAAFARALIAQLAGVRGASVALLRLDGRPIAAQVLLYGGSTAYTWKTAFDAEFAKFSPGVLLIDKVTDELFAAGTAQIESCSADGSFMEQFWTGRRMTVDLLIDVGQRQSVNFTLVARGERGYAWLRRKRDRLRASRWNPWLALPKRKSVAVTGG